MFPGSRAFVLCVAVAGVGCGVERDASASECHPQPPAAFGLGIAHVAGAYTVTGSASETSLLAGARRALELGSPTLKLFLTPQYQEKYPITWPAGITSLSSLAASAPMREVLALPFKTVVLTTYSFSMGTGDPWRAGDVPGLLDAEAQELEELVRVLAHLSQGTQRTYILQTWEGDWALTAGDLSAAKDAARAGRMAAWLSRRHAAIDAARTRYATPGVTFADAVEVNRVLDADEAALRVTTDVLPQTCTDLVSYSAWEAVDVGALPEAERGAEVERRLTTALARVRAAAPAGAGVYLGELGYAERETSNTGALLARALDVVQAQGVLGAVYWQIFDNECRDGACRGFWVLRPDGSLSDAGRTLVTRFGDAWAATRATP